jgi:DNA repair protein RadA/Sms
MKTVYECNECAATTPKWQGQCPNCGQWNSLLEVSKNSKQKKSSVGYAGASPDLLSLNEINIENKSRTQTGSKELDRVLGSGLVDGSVILIGGDPGIGKSTLLLQTLCQLCKNNQGLYVSGEESLQQIALRAKRLQVAETTLKLMAETNIEAIEHSAKKLKPRFVVIDSIQTMFTEELTAAPGSISQVRQATAQIVRLAKETGIIIFIIGHVTKEGALAGPRVLEHMVDTVLYFEGQKDSRFRVIRAFKNRYGAANEIGVFSMQESGLKDVTNPSRLFLSHHESNLPGSIIFATMEGSRPLLIEVQALVDESNGGGHSRRITQGFDSARLNLLLAVLNRHGDIPTYNYDIYINIVGGVKVTEPGIDLAVIFAILSSLKNKVIEQTTCVFGEIGLSGEIRPVHSGLERLLEAQKHGLKKAITPKGNHPKEQLLNFNCEPVSNLSEVMAFFQEKL